jgi:hypothetical protein
MKNLIIILLVVFAALTSCVETRSNFYYLSAKSQEIILKQEQSELIIKKINKLDESTFVEFKRNMDWRSELQQEIENCVKETNESLGFEGVTMR